MSLSLFVCSLLDWNYTNIGISLVLDEISFWNFLETFLGCLYTLSKLFRISCMSFSLLVGLLPYWYETNKGISPVLIDISVWHFWDMSLMLVHYFQMKLNFLYVCQCVILLTSLLKSDKYKDISSSWWYVFLKFVGDMLWMMVY